MKINNSKLTIVMLLLSIMIISQTVVAVTVEEVSAPYEVVGAINATGVPYIAVDSLTGDVYVTGSSGTADWSVYTTIKYEQVLVSVEEETAPLPKSFSTAAAAPLSNVPTTRPPLGAYSWRKNRPLIREPRT